MSQEDEGRAQQDAASKTNDEPRRSLARSPDPRRAGVVPLNYLHLDDLTLLGEPLRVTLWRGVEHARDPVEHVAIASVRDVADFWRREERVADRKDSVPYYSRGHYPTRREDRHRVGALGAFLDVDETETSFRKAHRSLKRAGVPHAMHPSFSNGLNGHRYRIFVPWVAERRAARAHLVERVFEIIGATPKADSWPTGGLYVPTRRPGDDEPWEILVHDEGDWHPGEPPPPAREGGRRHDAAAAGDHDPAEVRALLSFAAEKGWLDEEGDWSEVARMVAAWDHPDAYEILDEASAEADNYDGDENREKFRRYRRRAASRRRGDLKTLSSLFERARGEGWRRPEERSDPREDFADHIGRGGAPGARSSRRRLVGRIRTADAIDERPIDYFWRPWLPSGVMVMAEGDPGIGKTTANLDLCARVTTGAPFPRDRREREPGRVLVLAPEDSVEHVLVPRLRAAGADLSQVGFFELATADGIALPFTVDRLDDLLARAKKFEPTLVYGDSLMTMMGGVTNTHHDAEVRVQLARLHEGIRSIGAQLFATRHLHKGEKSLAVYAGGGSIAFAAFVRSLLLFSRDPDAWDDPSRGILAHTKNNLGSRAPSIRYEIVEAEPGVSRVEWLENERCPWTADELVSHRPDEDRRGDERKECAAFLREYFDQVESRGASVMDVKAAASEAGITASRETWTRARQDAELDHRGHGRGAVWFLAKSRQGRPNRRRARGGGADPLD